MEARETEAAAVLGLGQRQKTIVEERNKGERERQIAQIRDRVARIKQERNSARSSREDGGAGTSGQETGGEDGGAEGGGDAASSKKEGSDEK